MKIAIIGAGNMGSALAKQLSTNHTITLYDRHPEKMNPPCTLPEAVLGRELIFLAVKPQNLEEVAKELAPALSDKQILISLLAGTTLATLKSVFPKSPLIRMMPNLGVAYGVGMVALSTELKIDHKTFTTLLEPLGKIHWISEKEMDSFTSLAGSGPGFFFAMVEAMIDAGVTLGFSAAESTQLVHEMVEGSVELLKRSGQNERELINKISSRGGTTQAGLDAFLKSRVKEGIITTFMAAKARATELQK